MFDRVATDKTRTYILYGLIALFAFSAGQSIFNIMGERTLGSIVRYNIGTAVVAILILAFCNENFFSGILDFKGFRSIPRTQLWAGAVLGMFLGIVVFTYSGFGMIYGGIVLFILFTLGFSVFYIFTEKPFNALCLFWCAYPFIYFIQSEVEKLGFEKPMFDDLTIPFSAAYILILFVSVILANMKKNDFLRDKPVRFVYWLIFLSIPSIFFSGNPVKSSVFFFFDMIIPVIYLIVMMSVIKDEKQIERAIQFLLVSFLIFIVLTLYFYTRKGDSDLLQLYGAKRSILASSTMACLAAILFPFSFLLYRIKNSRWYLIPTGLFILLIVMSSYRTAQVGLLIAIVMLYALSKMPVFKKVWGIVFMFGILALSFFIFYHLQTKMNIENRLITQSSRILEGASLDEISSGRLEIWKSAIAMIKDHPVMGIGGGMWKDNAYLYRSKEYISYQPGYGYLFYYAADSHNVFLDFYLKYGLLTFLLFLYIVFYAIRKCHLLYIKENAEAGKKIIIAFYSCLVVWLFMSNLESNFYDYTLGDFLTGLLFYSLIGLVFAYAKIKNKNKVQVAGMTNA